jgi:hypothetical protein
MSHLTAMLHAHPQPAGSDGEKARRLIEACSDCAEACTICADACLHEAEVTRLTQCVRLNQDCADVCLTTGRMIARAGHADRPTLQLQLQACQHACEVCAEECERHAREMDMEHCRICAEACRACAEACEQMVGALVP